MEDWQKDFEMWKVEAFDRLAKTPSFNCNPLSATEIHTLTCSNHLSSYLLAIKSFLRFFSDVAVVIHDDGSLTEDGKLLIFKHVIGARIIDKEYADKKIEPLLKPYPNCARYRDTLPNAKQILDFHLLSRDEKIISLDSDVLFLKKPTELINWINDSKPSVKCSHETEPEKLNELKINVGLWALPRKLINLDDLESILSRISVFDWIHTSKSRNGNILSNFLVKYNIPYDVFNEYEYQNPYSFKDGAVFRHYFDSDQLFGYDSILYTDVWDVLRSLETVRSSSG